VPVVGFLDDTGAEVRFADVIAGRGTFALPRPVLRAFAAGYRPADHYGALDVLSVTTLANPAQAVALIKRHELFVDPLRNMWAVFGTIGHGMFEDHTGPDDITERRLVVDFEGQHVGGTFDLIETVDGELIGRDYKITSAYGVAMMLNEGVAKAKLEYALQANVYRWMLKQPGAQEVAEHDDGTRELRPFEHAGIGERIGRWQLVAWSRDWTMRNHGDTLKPIEIVDVPLIADERVERYLRERITLHNAAALCDDDGLPACSRAETWQGRRCASWCDAAPVCAQLKRKRKRS
jgi:hypothetical protein